MNDEELEGKFLSEAFGLSNPERTEVASTSIRTLEMVTRDIRNHHLTLQYLGQLALKEAIEIGRCLEEAKAMLPHGQWGNYLKNEVEYSQSTAQNFMRIFREYGASQQSLFGGQVNSQALGNLTYTKALQLLAIPDAEERERFVAERDVESMTTRELSEALKARDAALAEAAEAKAVADGLRLDTEHLQADLDEQKRVYEKNITSAAADIEQAKQSAKHWQEAWENASKDADAAKNAAASAEAKHSRLLQELEELRGRPIDVAVEVDTKAVEAARKAAIDEMTEKVNAAEDAKKQADEKCKAAEEAFAVAKKKLDELKAKGPEVRELTQEEKDALTAEAVEQARARDAQQIRDMEKQLAAADPDTAEFILVSETWQGNYSKMMDCLDRIAVKDLERAKKFRNAVTSVMDKWREGAACS